MTSIYNFDLGGDWVILPETKCSSCGCDTILIRVKYAGGLQVRCTNNNCSNTHGYDTAYSVTAMWNNPKENTNDRFSS